jgi:hypothetical protein
VKTTLWPPPCRQCGSDIKQQTEWSTDARNFKQTCHVCGHQGDWEPYPPPNPGYTLDLIEKAVPVRLQALEKARKDLEFARTLSLAYVPLRDRIDSIIGEVDDCLRELRP